MEHIDQRHIEYLYKCAFILTFTVVFYLLIFILIFCYILGDAI